MIRLPLSYRRQDVTLPTAAVPAWAESVPRWQQMDPVSWAVTESWHRWFGGPMLATAANPELFLVASRAASGLADLDFARNGAYSPQRFVATLPSVVLAPVLQMSGWVGPLLCLQAGESTLAQGLAEALSLVESEAAATIGVMTFEPGDLRRPSAAERTVVVRYFFLSKEQLQNSRIFLQSLTDSRADWPTDDQLYHWLDAGGASGSLPLGRFAELCR